MAESKKIWNALAWTLVSFGYLAGMMYMNVHPITNGQDYQLDFLFEILFFFGALGSMTHMFIKLKPLRRT